MGWDDETLFEMKIMAVRVGASKKYVMNRGQEQMVGYAVKAKKEK